MVQALTANQGLVRLRICVLTPHVAAILQTCHDYPAWNALIATLTQRA